MTTKQTRATHEGVKMPVMESLPAMRLRMRTALAKAEHLAKVLRFKLADHKKKRGSNPRRADGLTACPDCRL